MMNRIPGPKRSDAWLPAQGIEGLYNAMRIYDMAPEIASTIFDGIDDPTVVHSTFKKLYCEIGDPDEQRTLGCAFNYAQFAAYLRKGEENTARQIAKTLTKKKIFQSQSWICS